MEPPVECAVLDVNETLSDLSPLREVLEGAGVPGSLLATWFASVLRDGFALTAAGGSAPFAQIGKGLLQQMLTGHGLDADRASATTAEVMQTFSALPLHPDVVPGLEALRDAGLRVVTLTNGAATVAQGLLDRAQARHLVDDTLTVEDAGVWKPHARAYAYGLERVGLPAERAVMVAVHPWDIDGAARAGMRTAWVDRGGKGGYPEWMTAPDVVVARLGDLPGALAGA
jgi:2-haloacid dehalogenase